MVWGGFRYDVGAQKTRNARMASTGAEGDDVWPSRWHEATLDGSAHPCSRRLAKRSHADRDLARVSIAEAMTLVCSEKRGVRKCCKAPAKRLAQRFRMLGCAEVDLPFTMTRCGWPTSMCSRLCCNGFCT